MGERILAIPGVSTKEVGIACNDALGWNGRSLMKVVRNEGYEIFRFYNPDTVDKIENGSIYEEYPRDFATQPTGPGLHHLSYSDMTPSRLLGTTPEEYLRELIERRREKSVVYRFIKGVKQIKGRLRLWRAFLSRFKT